jgi:BolA family transcriptional regulator, general stress-responsive regulator
MMHKSKIDIIRHRLQEAFMPSTLDVIDESDQHQGHLGYQGGHRHFAIVIEASHLNHLSRIEAHRQIYALFSDLMPEEIHALRITIIRHQA